MEQSIVRKKLLEYLEETKMSKYKFAQRSGISLSTIYDIIRKEDYDKAADAFLEYVADYLYGNFNAGTLGDWEVGSDEFWNDGGDPYENFILNSAWLIGDENLQII